MSWDYRIVKYKSGEGFGLHEIHYDDNGVPWGMSEEPAIFVSEFGDDFPAEDSLAEIVDALVVAFVAVRRRPILEEPDAWAGVIPGDV